MFRFASPPCKCALWRPRTSPANGGVRSYSNPTAWKIRPIFANLIFTYIPTDKPPETAMSTQSKSRSLVDVSRFFAFESESSMCVQRCSKDDNEVHEANPAAKSPPPPQTYIKHESLFKFSLSVTAKAPHRIMHASDSIQQILQYCEDQIQGRSISTLYGPKTDPSLLTVAIKNMNADILHHTITIPAIILYDKHGVHHRFSVKCTPSMGRNDASLGCFDLRFESPLPPRILSIVCGGEREDGAARRSRRSRDNFLTGLELHCAARKPNPRAASDEEADRLHDAELWQLLL